MIRTLDVCLSFKLLENYKLHNTSIVIIDVIRASTTIATALHHGAKQIIPFIGIEETMQKKEEDCILVGERNGDKIEGFDYGNSPLNFVNNNIIKEKKIAITTTNGTKNLKIAQYLASNYKNTEIIIGSFVNHNAIKNHLVQKQQNVILVCSGWKSNPSIEDTLYAGKLADELLPNYQYKVLSDSTFHAINIYNLSHKNMFNFIMYNSARFNGKAGKLEEDIRYCLRENIINTVPILENDYLRQY